MGLSYWLLAISYLLTPGLALAEDTDLSSMKKRRQQGILTGMPFMANLAPRTFVDDAGRKVYFAKAPVRVVSLAPSITEILFAIGSSEQIVGVTESCDYPEEAKRKPKVGYTSPNLESILVLRPDLVMAPRAFLRADLLGKLEHLKVPTFIVDPQSFEDIPIRIQTIGRILDRSASADALAMAMRDRLTWVRSKTESLARVRVLYVLNSEPLITVGPGSFIHQALGFAGGSNVAGNTVVPYPHLNMESVLKEDPEIIVFPVGKAEGIPLGEQDAWQRWTTLSAIKHGRIRQISSDLLNRPGPRIIEGLERLARIIHPEAFETGTER